MILSPECNLPSSEATLLGAMLRMKRGEWPREEFRPPTMLNPRLLCPTFFRVTENSSGLEGGRGRRDRRKKERAKQKVRGRNIYLMQTL